MNRHLFLIILVSFTLFACKQTKPDKDKERINAVCDEIMKSFLDGKISEALQLIKQNTNVIDPSEVDSLNTTIKEHMATLSPSYGKILSYDFISDYKIKDYITIRYYILKFENYYLKFEFRLYKSNSIWTITGFNYNNEILEIFRY